jgi:hypothetical protein
MVRRHGNCEPFSPCYFPRGSRGGVSSSDRLDFHIDWGVSQVLCKQVMVGGVGYVYQSVTIAGQAIVSAPGLKSDIDRRNS